MHIGFLVFPKFTQLDATGPAQVLCQLPGARIHMLWKSLDPVPTDAGFSILPTTTLDDAPQLDVICVPGGPGQKAIMDDGDILGFVRAQGEAARYVTSVCSGSLLLGKAGLLDGYEAGCHWAWREALAQFGATPVSRRVVARPQPVQRRRCHGRHRFSAWRSPPRSPGISSPGWFSSASNTIQARPSTAGRPERAGPELEARVRGVLSQGFTPI